MVLDLSAFYSNADADGEIEVHIDMEAAESKLGVFPILKKEPHMPHQKQPTSAYSSLPLCGHSTCYSPTSWSKNIA